MGSCQEFVMKYREMYSFSDNDSRSILLNMAAPGSKVLEFGCANGNMTRYLSKHMGCKVCIVEYDKEAFQEAVQYAEDGICDDIQKFQWVHCFGYQFDYVIFADVLEHLKKPQEVLKKVHSVLAQDGSILISVPNIAHNDILINLYQNDFHYTPTGLLDDTHIHFFTEHSLEQCCQQAGYTVVQRKHTVIDTGCTEQKVQSFPKALGNILKERKNGSVYQYIVELKTSQFCREHQIAAAKELCEQETIISRLYFDYGNGYQEDACTATESIRNENGEYVLEYKAPLDGHPSAVRFDPLENGACVVKHFSAFSDGKELACSYPGSLGSTGQLFFYQDDPGIEIQNLSKDAKSIEIRAVFLIEGTAGYLEAVKAAGEETDREMKEYAEENAKKIDRIEETCTALNEKYAQLSKETAKQYQKQIDLLQGLYEDADCQRKELNRSLAEAEQRAQIWEQSYYDILNSRSWRWSKPIRIPGRIRERLAAKRERMKEQAQQKLKETLKETIQFSILMPVYNVDPCWLQKAIESIKKQDYKNWELCIVDDASTDRAVRDYLSKIKGKGIKVQFLDTNAGISAATNQAAEMASGDYILLMDDDDELADHALAECAKCIIENNPDVIYSDQDMIDEDGNHSCPLYKPDWSPDLLRSQMYIGHLCGFKRKLFLEAGGFRKAFDGSQDYDLLLRLTERAASVAHIPKILYSWRALPASTAANPDAKPYAQSAGLRALQEHLDRMYGEGMARAAETEHLYVYDVTYALREDIKVSIIIPTKDHAQDLREVIDSIFGLSSYRNFEIIIMNNNSTEQDTYEYFKEVQKAHQNVKVVEAFYEFNWSKLNNHGMREASGEVYIFLNNDMRILTADWIERLAGKALRSDVGAVGAMLLYEDDTIQHAGVVVGFGGWADHVYKGEKPVHCGTPFISPVVMRNVTAVTGACMAVSKKLIRQIGGFDENFIICGSDVEICVRSCNRGFVNIYDPGVKLFHFESKSRGTYVPDTDFQLSNQLYAQFRDAGDPYYNKNLDYTCCVPRVNMQHTDKSRTMPLIPKIAPHFRKTAVFEVNIPETTPIKFRKIQYPHKRWNILLPSLNPEDVFGGIATAYKFFEELAARTGYDCRVILVDAEPTAEAVEKYRHEYQYVTPEADCRSARQILPFSDRAGKTIPVSDNDCFIFTAWWTAYCIQTEYQNWKGMDLQVNPFIYFIQDYEPGFYAWSSKYMMADATYRSSFKQIAVFNSRQLKDYFDLWGYRFDHSFVFEPVLNDGLKAALSAAGQSVRKKKQILVYGRPNTPRNAFELLVEGLRRWVEMQPDVETWTVLSAGETHGNVELGRGKYLKSVGKLSIQNYAAILEETYAGVSLMVSPHPSYPPLEMAVFGVRVITNQYANKDLASFHGNIVSLDEVSPYSIADALVKICQEYTVEKEITTEGNKEYCMGGNVFPFMDELLYVVQIDEESIT